MRPLETSARVALTHDYLDQYGGAERTILRICEQVPLAPLYTSVYDRDTMRRLGFAEPAQRIVTSFMQRFPLRGRVPRYYFTVLYPLAFRSFDLSGYDAVVSSASFAAKALSLPDRTFHICYCYTPPRFLWDLDSDTAARSMPLHERPLAALAKAVLRRIDASAAKRVDHFIAISRTVAQRIRDAYGRDSVVVHPPVDTARFRDRPTRDDGFFLVVSRLNAYKRIDHVIRAANADRLPLAIVGRGPWADRLRAIAGPTVRLLGALPDVEVERLMSTCTALVLPGEEDFGITAVEAMAAGKPAIALGRGGATETIVDGVTGVLYDEPVVESFLGAVRRLRAQRWDAEAARSHASQFDQERFAERLDAAIGSALRAPIRSAVPAPGTVG